MPPPLEQQLMRQCGLRYCEAQSLVAESRRHLGMPEKGPWTKELREECVRRHAAKQGSAEVTSASSSPSQDQANSSSSHSSSTESQPHDDPANITSAPAPEPHPSLKSAKDTSEHSDASSKSQPKKPKQTQYPQQIRSKSVGRNTKCKTAADPRPVNMSKFQRPKDMLGPFRSCSSTLASFRSCSSEHSFGLSSSSQERLKLPIRPFSMRPRREQEPLFPGSQRSRSFCVPGDLRKKKKGFSSKSVDRKLALAHDDESSTADDSVSSGDSALEFAIDQHHQEQNLKDKQSRRASTGILRAPRQWD